MTFKFKRLLPIGCFFAVGALAQNTWFADGYHGGVFGHYPRWKTQFVMDKMQSHPDWRVNLEIEPETYDSVKAWDEKTYRAFQEFVAVNDHRSLEFTNPTYAQPYCYNISGESLIRQFTYGMDKLRQHFPDLRFTTYGVEEPCFTSALPQLLKALGFRYAVLKNPDTCFGGYTAAFGGELVNWLGPDGTKLVTVPRYACEKLAENSFWQTTAWNNSKEYINACLAAGIEHPVGMCYQDAGWKNGPWIGNPQTISSRYTLWSDYLEKVASKESATDWKFSQEDVRVSLMWGAQVLQKLAQEVRVAENKLVQTEKMATMARINGIGRWDQKAFDEAWRGLMLSQHHDCWIVPYNRLGSDKRTWAQHVTSWTGRSGVLCDSLAGNLFQASPSQWTVVNTLGFGRIEVVCCPLNKNMDPGTFVLKDENGNSVPCQLQTDADGKQSLRFLATVPPMGSARFQIEPGKAAPQLKALKTRMLKDGSLEIETDIYRMVLDAKRGGCITSLWDKQLKKQWVDPSSGFGLNELRGFLTDEKKTWSSLSEPVAIRLVEQGPLTCRVEVHGTIKGNPYTQTITLNRGERRIGFELEIDWKDNLHLGEPPLGKEAPVVRKNYYDDRFKLHLVFPNSLQNAEIVKNAPFDVCSSKLENTFFNRWDSIKNNVVLNWVDVHGRAENASMTLFSDHTTSYLHGKDYPLGLTVQYAGSGLWGVNYALHGKTRIEYALLPHSGNWEQACIPGENNRFNEPLLVQQGKLPAALKFILEVVDKSLSVSGLYFKGNKLYLRLYNEGASGAKKLTLNFTPDAMEETDLQGQTIGSSFHLTNQPGKTQVELNMPAFSIRTLCIKTH